MTPTATQSPATQQTVTDADNDGIPDANETAARRRAVARRRLLTGVARLKPVVAGLQPVLSAKATCVKAVAFTAKL